MIFRRCLFEVTAVVNSIMDLPSCRTSTTDARATIMISANREDLLGQIVDVVASLQYGTKSSRSHLSNSRCSARQHVQPTAPCKPFLCEPGQPRVVCSVSSSFRCFSTKVHEALLLAHGKQPSHSLETATEDGPLSNRITATVRSVFAQHPH